VIAATALELAEISETAAPRGAVARTDPAADRSEDLAPRKLQALVVQPV